MPSTLFATDSAKTHGRLIAGALVLFGLLFLGGYLVYRNSKIVDTYPIEVLTDLNQISPPTASTPEEVTNQYSESVSKVKTNLSASSSVEDQKNVLNDFFFTVRVPSELREAHLAALLEFKSAASTEKFFAIITELENKVKTVTATRPL